MPSLIKSDFNTIFPHPTTLSFLPTALHIPSYTLPQRYPPILCMENHRVVIKPISDHLLLLQLINHTSFRTRIVAIYNP